MVSGLYAEAFRLTMPGFATSPNSAKCACRAFAAMVRWRTISDRVRCAIRILCCSTLFTGTNLIADRCTASYQVALTAVISSGNALSAVRQKKGLFPDISDAPRVACDGKPLILLLTESQTSDYRGVRAMLTALPDADTLIAPSRRDATQTPAGQRTEGMAATGSARRWPTSRPPRASRAERTASNPSSTTRSSTGGATWSSGCLASCRTGVGSQPATTHVHTFMCTKCVAATVTLCI